MEQTANINHTMKNKIINGKYVVVNQNNSQQNNNNYNMMKRMEWQEDSGRSDDVEEKEAMKKWKYIYRVT